MASVLVIPFILPESCRWLMARGRKEKTLRILRRIARINRREVEDRVWAEVAELCDTKSRDVERSNYTYVDLFRSPNMRRISLLTILMWMVTSCIFDTTVRNIKNLNFEFYLSFMVAVSMELPADLLSIIGLQWIGRRWSASLCCHHDSLCFY